MLADDVKDGRQQDVEELLGLYLEALDEELVVLHPYMSTASVPGVKELEEEAQSTEGKSEVGVRDYTVRHIHFLSAPSLTLLTYAWTRIGKFSRRVAHLAHIWWKVPFGRTCAKPARHCHCRNLAITPTQHPGPFAPSVHTCD
jgi:hypothetical protein